MAKDFELIDKIKKTQDGDSLKELIQKHSGIYVDMINKYMPKSFNGVNKEDLLEEKDYSIYNAVIKFDETKNTKFSTYLGNLTNIQQKHKVSTTKHRVFKARKVILRF